MEAVDRTFDVQLSERKEVSRTPASKIVQTGPFRGLHHSRIFIDCVLVFLAVLLAVVWFGAPYFVRDYINRGLSGLPDYTGRVERVRINPITATFYIYDFHIDKKTKAVPVPFFYSPRWKVALQWSEILHGVQRASVTIYDPQVNLVSGESSSDSQFSISGVWINAIKQLIPWRVNQLIIRNGDVHLLDFHADPKVDLELNHFELDAENMSNSKKLKVQPEVPDGTCSGGGRQFRVAEVSQGPGQERGDRSL
jgi:hypothetical protein